MVTSSGDPFARWHDLDRAKIDWHPTIDEKKCTGCGLCVVTCGEKRNVFGYDPERRKAVVLAPDHCMVGCVNCMMGCLWSAITFPEAEKARDLARSLPQSSLDAELGRKLTANPDLLVEKRWGPSEFAMRRDQER